MHRSLSSSVVLAVCLVWSAACSSGPTPYVLAMNVFPTAEGVDVLVEVDGGAPDVAWIGFGAGPGAPPGVLSRVHSVQGRDREGHLLPMVPVGPAGYEVDLEGASRPWKLSYSLDLTAAVDPETFYRASVRGVESLILVGSDAWARFFGGPESLQLPLDGRPPGRVLRARINFDVPESWQVVTTAAERNPRSFELLEHPVGSVFALGPFTVSDHGPLRVARHRDWGVLPEESGDMLVDLLEALRGRLGERRLPAGGPSAGATTLGTARAVGEPLVLLSPLPEAVRPEGGLRTTGMVRGDSLMMYAGLAPGAEPSDARIRTAMAVFMGHELFHLYVPSAVSVGRDLSWLSEGWAMHMGRLAAVDAGFLRDDQLVDQVEETYRRYLEIGGYRAGSLPAASMANDSQRDLLYLRGELVLRLLSQEWERKGLPGSLEATLWQRLSSAGADGTPVSSDQVRTILEDLVDPLIVRRYVEGTAPLTPPLLGIPLY